MVDRMTSDPQHEFKPFGVRTRRMRFPYRDVSDGLYQPLVFGLHDPLNLRPADLRLGRHSEPVFAFQDETLQWLTRELPADGAHAEGVMQRDLRDRMTLRRWPPECE